MDSRTLGSLASEFQLSASSVEQQWSEYKRTNGDNKKGFIVEFREKHKAFTPSSHVSGMYSLLSLPSAAPVLTPHSFSTPTSKRSAPVTSPSTLQSGEPKVKMARHTASQNDTATPQLPGSPAAVAWQEETARATASDAKYNSRTNAGQAMRTLNAEFRVASGTEVARIGDCEVHSHCLRAPYSHMADEPRKVANLLDARVDSLGDEALAAANLSGRFPLETRSVEPVVSVGRIDCEVEGRLSGTSVVLETTRSANGPARIRVNFNDIPSFAVFPGQVVGVTGINPTGALFELDQLCVPPPLSRRPRLRPVERPVTAMVAFGPYTTAHSLDYLGLKDLCRVVEEERPSMLVLVGPFVDEQHSSFKYDMADPAACLGTTRDPLYIMEERVAPLLRQAAASTRVVILPSQRDVSVDPVFPQPPATSLFDAETRARVQLMPNPAVFEAGGVQFAISGADILKGLAAEELSKGSTAERAAGRLPNLCRHVLRQRSMYPLFPAQRGAAICQTQAAAFALTEAPDVLILGSDLSPFAQTVEEVACVNPGKLVRASGAGGSYAKIAVSAGDDDSALGRPKVSVDVVRI